MTHETRHIVLSERTAEAVRVVVEQWVGLLVERKYAEALALLATRRPLLDPPSTETGWTPELLAQVIQNCSLVQPREDRRTFAVTPIATAMGDGPRFEVTWFERPVGCGWGASVGHAHYDLPLNGAWSDVTATFDILDTEEGLALALDDVHVM
jgi:hypothetical protein